MDGSRARVGSDLKRLLILIVLGGLRLVLWRFRGRSARFQTDRTLVKTLP